MQLSACDEAVNEMARIVFTPSDPGTRIHKAHPYDESSSYVVYWKSSAGSTYQFDVLVQSLYDTYDHFQISADMGAIEFSVRVTENKWTMHIDQFYSEKPKRADYIKISTLKPIFQSTEQTSVCDRSFRQSNGIPAHILHLSTGSAGTYAPILGNRAYPKTFRLARALRKHASDTAIQRIQPHTSPENILHTLQSRLAMIPIGSLARRANQSALHEVSVTKSLDELGDIFRPGTCWSSQRPLTRGPNPTWVTTSSQL